MKMAIIDLFVYINDIIIYILDLISIFFTVKTDIFNISNRTIFFNNDNEFSGFKVKISNSEYNRRAIAWFYRHFDTPDIHDWNLFKSHFKLDTIPGHLIEVFYLNSNHSDIVIIDSIDNEYIRYSVNYISIILTISFGALLPENYIKNFRRKYISI